MSNKFNKKMAQKGGMMIEALAMLGLIAVVTPTMYKKSAERTLEVEDINTATTMRSVMTAADSYVASHYGELVQEIANNAENNQAKVIGLDKLKPYLPYGFNTNKLYDYNSPKVSVVRNGNNLTAFVLFPAKEKGEDGLGQERTVRIATLVGANGGYVNNGEGEDNTTAKGIGGIWNLSSEEFTKVFGSENPNIYSIVTASSDAINNTNTEEDTDKFLYRTDANGRWHNTMRTDLFMGDNQYDTNDVKTADGYYKEGTYSIRSVKSLIIGAEEASKHSETDDEGNTTQVEDNYGLYVTGANPKSFIQGSLEAANSQFKVDQNALVFGKYTEENSISENFKVDSDGNLTNEGSIKLGGVVKEGEEGVDPTYMIEGSNSSLNLMDERIYISGKDKTVNESLIINADGTKGDGEGWNKEISYNTYPTFPVKVDSNMRVDGILATAQLDTQNIRAATLDVGSTNIDDENKWLKVDANGIHGRNPADAGDGKTNTVFDVKSGEVNIATGTLERNGNNFDTSTGGANNSFRMTNSGDDAVIELATSKNGVNNSFALKKNGAYLVSNQNIDINLDDSTNVEGNDNRDIKLRNKKVQQQIQGSDVVFSSLQNGTKDTSVKVKGTNFQVSDIDSDGHEHIVFSVKGNNANNDTLDPMTKGSSETANVAVHGETLFTSSLDDSASADRKYMKIGSNYNSNAMVNILQSSQGFSEVLTVDGDTGAENSYIEASGSGPRPTYYNRYYKIAPGTVYIRKGMVEVKPDISMITDTNDERFSADKGSGLVKASRFVANNIDENGNATFYAPQFFSENDYTKYNGAEDTNGRYDTYMVNPAYTSVMHDIKLTTRGGARLSDILPDFINKGIYITTNTYKDNIKAMKFKFDSTDGVQPDGGNAASSSGEIVLGNADSWASPYLGFVPAPQCPPGYNRLITLAPQSFMMAQAGQMQKGTVNKRGESNATTDTYYTKNQVPEDSAFTAYQNILQSNDKYIQQGFVKVAADNVDVDTSNLTVDNKKVNGTAVAKTSELNLHEVDAAGNTIEGRPGNPYFLVSYGDTTPPLTIQQSTWLKTNVIPVGRNNTSDLASIEKDTNKGYTVGWAALMGFVYDAATYQPIIDKLSGQNLIAYDGSSNSVYWNIFPVRRSTLEAYATTYCYFDRNGIYWNEFKNGANGEYIDHYNAVNDYKTNTEKKNISEEYKQRLNDPTLKYDEVW